MLMRLIPAAAVTAFCAASAWQILYPPKPKLIYNTTTSAPIGWYAVERKRLLQRDDLVAAFAPQTARNVADMRGYLPDHVPLIKTVWAIGGERVCHDGQWVRVPNRPDISVLGQDGLGRALPVMSGCYRLNADEVFLVSNIISNSWDSRYFGPVTDEMILGPVRYLGKEWEASGRVGGLGTGSWRGGQDKRREASFGAISLSAHLFWEASQGTREAPIYLPLCSRTWAFRSPPTAEPTRNMPQSL